MRQAKILQLTVDYIRSINFHGNQGGLDFSKEFQTSSMTSRLPSLIPDVVHEAKQGETLVGSS